MHLEILNKKITEIVQLIKSRELSVYDLVNFSIHQTRRVHQLCNVIVDERFEQALEEAKQIDRMIATQETPSDKPLLGIPFSIKASIGFEGFSLDMGTWSRHGRKSKETATTVKRLLDAGAILICSTNVSELGLWHTTTNPIYGTTKNPWNESKSPGSSSGGAAALLSGGGGIFALATDLDGSQRLAANFCGVYAHKASRGVTPLTGSFPYTNPNDFIALRSLDSIGPLTRHAADLGLILKIISGPCSQDPMSMTGELNIREKDSKNLKISILENPKLRSFTQIAPEIRLSIRKIAQQLSENGAQINICPHEIFFDSYLLWRLLIHRTFGAQLLEWYSAGKPRHGFVELARHFMGQSEHTFSGSLLMLYEQLILAKKQDALRSLDADLNRLLQRLASVFKDSDVIVLPIYHQSAPSLTLSEFNLRLPVLTGIFNALGFATTAVPVGVSGKGMPVGVQIVGPAGSDFLTIKIAELIGEFIPPPIARHSLALRS